MEKRGAYEIDARMYFTQYSSIIWISLSDYLLSFSSNDYPIA